MTGDGLTVMLKVRMTLVQPLRVAVAWITPVIGTPVFTAAVKLMSPLPVAPRPISGLLLVQFITEPAVLVAHTNEKG